jgi:hypothetical protein
MFIESCQHKTSISSVRSVIHFVPNELSWKKVEVYKHSAPDGAPFSLKSTIGFANRVARTAEPTIRNSQPFQAFIWELGPRPV